MRHGQGVENGKGSRRSEGNDFPRGPLVIFRGIGTLWSGDARLCDFSRAIGKGALARERRAAMMGQGAAPLTGALRGARGGAARG